MKLRKYRFQLPLHENTVRFFKLVYFLKRKACGYSGSLAFANEKPVITHETRLFVFIGRITLLFFGDNVVEQLRFSPFVKLTDRFKFSFATQTKREFLDLSFNSRSECSDSLTRLT